jgi:hypothetical protein
MPDRQSHNPNPMKQIWRFPVIYNWENGVMARDRNERVELEMKIMKYRAMARAISDDTTTKRIETFITELEQKLKEIDE